MEVSGLKNALHTCADYFKVIIAMDRLSPQEAGKERTPVVEGVDELPLIRAFSDITWMSWKALADATDSDPKNIHYFMSLSITNEQTQRILSRAIREVLPEAWCIPDWPGFEFGISTPQGQAILGESWTRIGAKDKLTFGRHSKCTGVQLLSAPA